MTRQREALEYAIRVGYYIQDGQVFSAKNKLRKLYLTDTGYPGFSVRFKPRREGNFIQTILVHRLVGYYKYGQELFQPGRVLRHIDNNKLNFHPANIVLGTPQENSRDIPATDRLFYAVNAASSQRKFTDVDEDQIRAMYKETHSYKQVQEKWGIPSKGSLYYILHHKHISPTIDNPNANC